MDGAPSATGAGRHKVILLGEHAVVHGHPALGAPLGQVVEVTLAPGGSPGIEVEGPGRPEPLVRAFERMASAAGLAPRSMHVTIRGTVATGAGLGSSAALCVGFARAALALSGEAPEPARVHEIAQAGERVFHGNPSGIDAWLAASSGPALFSRQEPPRAVPLRADLHLAVLVDEVHSSTAEMVARVARRLEEDPGGTGDVFRKIGRIVLAGAAAAEAGDTAALGRLMGENHSLLRELGVSTQGLDALVEAAMQAGALGAKMTGGGGGGAAIALCAGEREARRVTGRVAGRTRLAFATRIEARR
jgi:mevalonate kinase